MNAQSTTFPTAALIDGKWITSSKTFPVLDPATGEKLADVPDLNADDARRAIDAAHKAFPPGLPKPAKDRPQSCAAGTNCSSPKPNPWRS